MIIADSKGNSLTINQQAWTAHVSIKAGQEQNITSSLNELKNGCASHDKIKEIFAENNKDVWQGFLQNLKIEHE